jgi:hypothetical protein
VNILYRKYTLSKQADEVPRDPDISGLLTVTASCRFSDHWFTRFNWNRVMSNDNRDSDVFLLGVGYRWAAR